MKKKILKLLPFFIVVLIMLSMPAIINAETVSSGKCGTNLTWTLDDSGVLTISGTGKMTNYEPYSNPWCYEDITSVVIENGVTSIGNWAFFDADYWYETNRSKLVSVSIPESVTYIGSGAFEGCSSLTSVNIPESVTYIGSEVFFGCSSLKSVNIPDGVTHIYDATFLNCSALTSIDIPESVISIGKGAFHSCGLTEIKFPEGLTSIGEEAFEYCDSLTEVILPDSLTSIGVGAFSGCPLNSFTIPKGVTKIEDRTFKGYLISSVIISEGVISIGEYAFSGCSNLKSVTLPESLTSIGKGIFKDCKNLKNVYAASAESWCNITFNDAMAYPYNLYFDGELVTDLIIPEGITEIKDYAFYNCTTIESVTFPESLTTVGESVFKGCSSLEDVYAASVESWCNITFEGAMAYPYNLYFDGELVTDLIIPEGITEIKDYAFANCSTIISVSIPESLNSVGKGVFKNCKNLNIYAPSVELWCNITFEDAIFEWWHNLYFNGEIVTDLIIPDEITEIKDYAFAYCSSIESVSLPECLKSIGKYAFSNCDVEKMDIPDNVTSIGDGAFYGCYLDSLTIPKGIKNIEGGFACCHMKTLIIPEGITSIGDGAFYGCGGLEKVILPEGLISIGNNAFYECYSLEEINLPDSIESIGGYAFGYCPLFNVTIPEKVTKIEECTFLYCEDLIEVKLPKGITSIGDAAFCGCKSLEKVNIPDGVKSIGNQAFADCWSLKEIFLPEGLTELGDAFQYCKSLEKITVPDSVTMIYWWTFNGCISLKEFTFPAGTKEINSEIFIDCNLEKVIIPESVEIIYGYAFSSDEIYFEGDAPTIYEYSFDCSVIYFHPSKNGWEEAKETGYWNGFLALPFKATGIVGGSDSLTYEDPYIIKVVDKYVEPVSGAKVVIDSVEYETNAEGMIYIERPKNEVNLSITAFTFNDFNNSNYKPVDIIDYITLTDVKSTVTGVSCNGEPIHSAVCQMNTNSDKTAEIVVKGYSKYEIEKYELIQGKRTLAVVETTDTQCTFTVPVKNFEEGEAVFVKMYISDGTETVAQLNISPYHMKELSVDGLVEDAALEFWVDLGKLGKFCVPIAFLSESNLVEIEYSEKDRTIKVGFNFDLDEVSELAENGDKWIQNKIKGMLKNYKKVEPGFGCKYIGYVEIEYLGNDEYRIKTSCVKAVVSAKVPFEAQASLYGVVGVFFKAELSANGELELKTTYCTPENPVEVDEGFVSIYNQLDLEGGVYVLWKFGTASIYGTGSMGFKLGVTPVVEFRKIYLEGAVGARWSLVWGLFKGEYPFWNDGVYLLNKEESELMSMPEAEFYDLENYSVNPRTYLNTRSEWLNEEAVLFELADNEDMNLQTSVYDGIAPKTVMYKSTPVMVWLDDNAERDTENFQALYYSVYENGIWSTPRLVDNNDTFDCEFDVISDGENLYVVYTEQKSLVEELEMIEFTDPSSESVQVSNPEKLDKLINNVELNICTFDGESFSAPVKLTNNNICETLPDLSITDGVVTATWGVTNTLGLISDITASEAIYQSQLIDGEWSEPYAVIENQTLVSDVSYGTLGGESCTAYTVDSDGNAKTYDDIRLVVIDESNNMSVIDSGSIFGASFETIDSEPVLMWNNDGIIRYIASINDEATGVNSEKVYSDYQVVTIDEGTLLTYTKMNKEGGRNIHGVYIDSEGVNGASFPITNAKGYIDNYAVINSNNNLKVAYTETKVKFKDDSVLMSVSSNDEFTSTTDFKFGEIEVGTDIKVTSDDVIYTKNADGNDVALVDLNVSNIGFTSVDSFVAYVYDENNSLIMQKQYLCKLLSGEADVFELEIEIPENISEGNCNIVVMTADEEKNTDDNTVDVCLAYCDLSVSVEQRVLGTKNCISVTVENFGNIPSDGTVSFYLDEDKENPVEEISFDAIEPGGFKVFIFEIPDDVDLAICTVTGSALDCTDINNTDSLKVFVADEDAYSNAEGKTVQNPEISTNFVSFDKYIDTAIAIEILSGSEYFTGIEGLKNDVDYSYSSNLVTLSEDYLNTLTEETHFLNLVFEYADTVVTRTLIVEISNSAPISLSGNVSITGEVRVNETLTADVSQISPRTTNLCYIWVVDGRVVCENESYIVKKEDLGKELSLVVNGKDGYEGSFTVSEIVELAIAKTPAAPIVTSVTCSTVTLLDIAGMEYSLDKIQWQTDNVFKDLSFGETYMIYARVAQTDYSLPSESSAPVCVTINSHPFNDWIPTDDIEIEIRRCPVCEESQYRVRSNYLLTVTTHHNNDKVTLDISSVNADNLTDVIITALYDGEGKLVWVKSCDSVVKTTTSIPNVKDGYLKVLLWNEQTLKALCKFIEIDL